MTLTSFIVLHLFHLTELPVCHQWLISTDLVARVVVHQNKQQSSAGLHDLLNRAQFLNYLVFFFSLWIFLNIKGINGGINGVKRVSTAMLINKFEKFAITPKKLIFLFSLLLH